MCSKETWRWWGGLLREGKEEEEKEESSRDFDFICQEVEVSQHNAIQIQMQQR